MPTPPRAVDSIAARSSSTMTKHFVPPKLHGTRNGYACPPFDYGVVP